MNKVHKSRTCGQYCLTLSLQIFLMMWATRCVRSNKSNFLAFSRINSVIWRQTKTTNRAIYNIGTRRVSSAITSNGRALSPLTVTITPSLLTRFSSSSSADVPSSDGFFAEVESFQELGVDNEVLLKRLENMGLKRPTKVQEAAFRSFVAAGEDGQNLTVGAETGSGKTYAYLIPLINDILNRKKQSTLVDYDYARALILVPNKELVQQVARMAMPLAGGPTSLVYGTVTGIDAVTTASPEKPPPEIVRLAIMPGGLSEPEDFPPFRKAIGLGGEDPPIDLVITTPASFGPFGLKPKFIGMFEDIESVVIDEADMLLDGGYIRQLENVLTGFRRADRLEGVKQTQHMFVAATLPNSGLRSVDAYLRKKFPDAERISVSGMHNARHYGLKESTIWIEEESKKGRMEQLVKLLQAPIEEGGLKNEKVIVFLNSVDDVEGACQALIRSGLGALAYHAKMSLKERTETLDKFRNVKPGEDGLVLVSTDLAARGLDVPGVTAVVQLQFAGNVVAHLHRMGRSGRAGQRNGRGIVFYGEKEQALVEVVKKAEDEQEQMVLEGDVIDLDDDAGTVEKAFSRKRGFTKKIKKERRRSETA